MPKTYDIENFIDDKTFTYQLYADMEVATTGTSEVTVSFTEDSEVLKASWTVSGQAVPTPPFMQQFGVFFTTDITFPDNLIFGVQSESDTSNTSCFVFDNISPFGTDNAPGTYNGNWELKQIGTTFNFYYNTVLTLTMQTALPIANPIINATPWANGAFGGSITNLVLY